MSVSTFVNSAGYPYILVVVNSDVWWTVYMLFGSVFTTKLIVDKCVCMLVHENCYSNPLLKTLQHCCYDMLDLVMFNLLDLWLSMTEITWHCECIYTVDIYTVPPKNVTLFIFGITQSKISRFQYFGLLWQLESNGDVFLEQSVYVH